ncbi:Cyclin N-terminal domain-containing protein 1 [Trichostrongylus colubriformis]|uniref:Cyclin N-terminal domain-containing protein 1 n=1 Tax=Trichostrongylus colubriformis TaxID=6319 RepID=A0AAN8EX40_TRICO
MSSSRNQQDDEPEPDPDFTSKTAELPPDYRSDWICELALQNSDRIMATTENDNDYLTLESVQYIFTVCVRLRLPHDIRYLAVLIFTKFMRVHSVQVLSFLNNVKMSDSRRRREWEKVEANLSRQTTLRMLSSIQIASKVLSYHDSLSSKQICSCLRSLGFAYTQRAALKSELRILKTLNFRLPQSPLIYSESLLKSVVSSWPQLDFKSIWEHTLLFLDIVFLHHEQIYQVVLQSAVANTEVLKSIPRADIERVKADWMLLGASTVAAAALCVVPSQHNERIVSDLSELAGTPREDVAQMASAITRITIILQKSAQATAEVGKC